MILTLPFFLAKFQEIEEAFVKIIWNNAVSIEIWVAPLPLIFTIFRKIGGEKCELKAIMTLLKSVV